MTLCLHENGADEAHKASGNHSYVQCISYLQACHPHFRIVALTATPGRTTEKVQEVVDKLHISRIEIREAESPEISKYMFKKVGHSRIRTDASTRFTFASLLSAEHSSPSNRSQPRNRVSRRECDQAYGTFGQGCSSDRCHATI